MGKVYLPTAAQMANTVENLKRIAGAIGSKADVSSWSSIERVVKSGNASRLFPIGTQFTVSHSEYGDMLYDVVAHDYFKSEKDGNAHTMTLMCHDAIATIRFDSPEAFYYAENELPAGTYNFTIATAYSSWAAGTYQFTLTQALPKGGQLAISGDCDSTMTSRQVTVFANQTTDTATESVAITSGNGGTSLGTFGTELNHSNRVSYGSNNYKESAIRQFLNSSAEVGQVWSPQTKFDRPPSWASSTAGFVNGLDEEFLSVIGKVIVPCSANALYESPDSTVIKGSKYTITDKFYLASQREVFGTTYDTVEDDSVTLPYYGSATNTDRIKYRDGSAEAWWLRSATSSGSAHVRMTYYNGTPNHNGASIGRGCVPVCTIV